MHGDWSFSTPRLHMSPSDETFIYSSSRKYEMQQPKMSVVGLILTRQGLFIRRILVSAWRVPWRLSVKGETCRQATFGPELFPASPGAQLQEITVSIFRSNRVTTPDRIENSVFSIRSEIVVVFDPVGSKKCRREFQATGALKKREIALDRCTEKTPSHSEARKTNLRTFRGNSSWTANPTA